MTKGKIILIGILVLATAGLAYAGYTLIKAGKKKKADEAAAKALLEKTEAATAAAIAAAKEAGTTYSPSPNITSANITWAAESGFPIKKGDIGLASGSLVKRLQTALNKTYKAGLVVDGYFGNLTEAALITNKESTSVTLDALKRMEAMTTQTTTPTGSWGENVGDASSPTSLKLYLIASPTPAWDSNKNGEVFMGKDTYVGLTYRSGWGKDSDTVYVHTPSKGNLFFKKASLYYKNKNGAQKTLDSLYEWF